MESLLLKLFFVYSIQSRCIGNLNKHLLETNQHEILIKNAKYVRSLMTDEQHRYWNDWLKELQSPTFVNYISQLEEFTGLFKTLENSTHIEEMIQETRTVLTLEDAKIILCEDMSEESP